jgi:hypothetical protein
VIVFFPGSGEDQNEKVTLKLFLANGGIGGGR